MTDVPSPTATAEASVSPKIFTFHPKRLPEPPPTSLEDAADVLDFISRGGRLPGVDYNQLPAEERDEGFRHARAYLNRNMGSVINGVEQTYFSDGDDDLSYHHSNPNNPDETFGTLYALGGDQVDEVMEVAAYSPELPDWDGMHHLTTRIAVLDRFMATLYEQRHVFAGLMALSQGKSGNEVFRDMQELFDFARNYRKVPDAILLHQAALHSSGDTAVDYHPIQGVIGVWQPFNFTCIGVGEAMSALMLGNRVVIHTSARNVGPYKWCFEKMLEAGVPPSRLQFVIPHDTDDPSRSRDDTMSESLAQHPLIKLIAFTGSHAVASRLKSAQAEKATRHGSLDYKLNAETGGYNPLLVAGLPDGALDPLLAAPREEDWGTFLAHLEPGTFLYNFRAALVDSVCGLQSHKCSAMGEIVVALDETRKNGLSLLEARLLQSFAVEILNRVTVADVTQDPKANMGGLIDMKAKDGLLRDVQQLIERGASILTGDGTLAERSDVEGLPTGLKPILWEVASSVDLGELDAQELFGPVVRWNAIEGGREALVTRANSLGYALTSSVIDSTLERGRELHDRIPHGVSYVASGPLVDGTTAAPAPQVPFGGHGKSGTGTANRPGTMFHPLDFAQPVSRGRLPRAEWGQALNAEDLDERLVFAWVNLIGRERFGEALRRLGIVE